MTERDDHIREIAYFLWLEEGCPDGEADRHCRDAEALLASEPEAFEGIRIKGAPDGEPAGNFQIAPGA